MFDGNLLDVMFSVDGSGFNLTTNNFTFLKEPVGIPDSNMEIIREAKKKVSNVI
jgi:hypothetical protein